MTDRPLTETKRQIRLSAGHDTPGTDDVISVTSEESLAISGPSEGDTLWLAGLLVGGDWELWLELINLGLLLEVEDDDGGRGGGAQPVSVWREDKGVDLVTGYLDSAAKAMGLTEQVEHDRRYDQADEYLQVLYKLWEGSWENDAVLNDPVQRIYARPDKVHKVKHEGEFYQVEGYHLSEPSPQRTPVLFQAGSSDRGLVFAGRHAECVFISGQTKAATKAQVDKVRASAVAAGRNPDDIKLFMGLNVIVAPTEAEALAKRDEYLSYASAEAGVAHFSSSTGIDFADYELDEPIQYVKSNAIQSATKVLQNNDWTRRKLLEQHALGGRYITLVGSPEQVADELESWIAETGLDGFNLTRIVTPESYVDFIDLVVPELQRRGSYKTAYDTGSLRQKLFADGDAHLPQRHTGAAFRHSA